MRIGIDGSALTKTQPTGVEIATKDLLSTLFRQSTDHQFILYVPETLPATWHQYPNLTVKHLPATRLWTQRVLGPTASRDKLDLFWSPSYMLPLTFSGKGVVTVHGMEFMKHAKSYTLKNWLLSYLTILFAKSRAHHIIAVSESVKKDLQRYLNIPAEKITVIYNAVSPVLFQKIQLATKNPDNPPYILTVGRVEPRKNTLRLVEAFGRIAKKHPHLKLYIAGFISDQLYGLKVSNLIGQLQLSDRVVFLGHLDQAEIATYYKNATVLASVSLDEGFGIPVLEGFAANVPVVASQHSATAEVAGEAAILVNAQDTASIAAGLDQVLGSPDLVETLVQKGQYQLLRFSWEKSADSLLELFGSL